MSEKQDSCRGVSVALDYLGCKLNQAEVQELAGELAAAGYVIVPPNTPADIYVLNTCTVTHVADRKSRQMLRQARRRNPAARLVAIGCGVESDARRITAIEGIELVLGNDRKHDLVTLLGQAGEPQTVTMTRTRAFLRVQEGCQNHCTYCIVPKVRSQVSCVPGDTVIQRAQALEAAGFQEIVITGTEIGTWQEGEKGLKELLERLIKETTIPRIRISSLQPTELQDDLVDLWENPRLCPHFHLSLQSGSNRVLQRMKRRYSLEQYSNAVNRLRQKIHDVAITTDIIVGFPGETEKEFEESCRTCRELGFARMHIFPYSPRPHTEAAAMPAQVPEPVKKERSRVMLEIGGQSAREYRESCFGRTFNVLFERSRGRICEGHTGNYLKVYTKSYHDLAGKILPVRIENHYRDGVFGSPEAGN